jgi:predicted acylesterase/phospholipase RssA
LSHSWLTLPKAELKSIFGGIMNRPHHYLALSGGGPQGAYGAGILVGWTKTGTRPEFTMVTGVSTGSLIAPFAFLGPEYDDELRHFYTDSSTKDIMVKHGLLATIEGDAAASTAPLKERIKKTFDDEFIARIAAEHRKGRRLYIGTTNLDATRPVIWNIGAIAASGAPGANDLIHEVILASASIPVAFPPVFINVEAEGQTYQEIHVDGGVTRQVYIYPMGVDFRKVEKALGIQGPPHLHVIRNAKLEPKAKTVPGKLFPIAETTVSSLIRTQGIGDLDKIYLETQRDGLDYNLTYIPDNFDVESHEPFDKDYMRALFKVGYDLSVQGKAWMKLPPCYEGCKPFNYQK